MRQVAWALSLAGLVPFLWCCVEIWLSSTLVSAEPERVMIGYGAIIASFLGGIIWARALLLVGNSQLSAWLLCVSIAPSCAGLLALTLPNSSAFLALMLAFAGQLGTERALHTLDALPEWFAQLRLSITCAVLALLGFGWLGV